MSPLSFVAVSQTFEPPEKIFDAATAREKVKQEAQEENVSFFGVVKS